MTYDEIINAFEFCISDGDCNQCSVKEECSANLLYLDKQVLTSYRELLKENRHMKSQLDVLLMMVDKLNEMMDQRAELTERFMHLTPIVRCKDCEYCEILYPVKEVGKERIKHHWCKVSNGYTGESDYCSYGKRRDKND